MSWVGGRLQFLGGLTFMVNWVGRRGIVGRWVAMAAFFAGSRHMNICKMNPKERILRSFENPRLAPENRHRWAVVERRTVSLRIRKSTGRRREGRKAP